MNLHQLKEEEYKLFPKVIKPEYLAKRTTLTVKTGVQKLVELDRYSLRDNTLQTLKEGDVIIAEILYDPKYPVQGYGRVKSIDRDTNSLVMQVEYPESLQDKNGNLIDLENLERPLSKVIKPLEVYWEQIAYRVARGAASVEKSRSLRRYWFKKFFNELKHYNGIPGGRILYGAGSGNNVTLFNCFQGDTPVHTKDGVYTIKDLKGEVEVLSQDGVYRKATFKSYGRQELFRVEFANGEVVEATAGHEWVVTKKKGGTEKVTTLDLVGRKTPLVSSRSTSLQDEREILEGIRHGVVYGDGSINNGKYCHVLLFGEKRELSKYFEGESAFTIKPHYKDEYLGIYGVDPEWKKLPSDKSSDSYWLGFIRGLLATDGCVDTRGSVMLHSSNLDELVVISDNLKRTGILYTSLKEVRAFSPYNGEFKPTYKLQFVKNSILSEDLLKSSHREKFDNSVKSKKRQTLEVVSVTPTNRIEEVFCCDEPETHTFVVGSGILTGNCFVLPAIPDSRRGISRHRETTMEIMSRGGGVGSNGSALRPKDALVEGVNGKSSGSVSWLGDLARLTDLVQQGGSRRGAQMIGLADWHPDLIYFMMCKIQNPHVLHKISIESKNEIISHTAESLLIRDKNGNPVGVQDTQFMTGANISVLVSDDFMKAVESKSTWTLRFPDVDNLTPEQKDYYNSHWHENADVRHWEALGYPVKDYSTYNAEDLWDLINVAARFSAEPGIIFMDTCQNESNSWYYAPLVVTNPCFTGDMRLLTAEGYKTFAELDGQEFEVVNHLGNITKGKVWKSGDKNTVEIKFYNSSETIRCTPDHRFMLTDGSECEAQHLAGKRIMPFFNHNNTHDELYVKLGFIQGDGSLTRLHSEHRHKGLEINLGVNDNDVRAFFGYEVDGERKVYTTEFTELLLELGFSSDILPERGLPSTITSWTREQKRAFLKGLYSANGSVINSGRVSFKTTSSKVREQLQELLLEFDIPTVISVNKAKDVEFDNGTYTCRESYDISINKHKDRIKFYNEIGFLQDYKMDKLKFNLIETSPKVQIVKSTGKVEAVYDFHEPETHWGVVEGIVAHNCGEQPLPAYAVCNLFAINLANFYDAQANKVDYPRLRRTVRVAHRFADNIIDHSFYFLEENEKMAKAERRIGLGVMGLADLLIYLKQAYGSEESLKTIDELFKFIRDEVYLASTEVAEEKGSFEYFDKVKYLQSGFVKRLPENIQEAIRTKGVRNVCNLTVAPTGSTGTMVGVATGLEPYFSFIYYRSGRLGKFIPVITDIAVQWLEDNGYTVTEDNVEGLIKELPEYFVSANELPPLSHVKVQATIQQYIDSAISKTANAPSTFTVEDNKELYMEAWKSGCKGVTVYVDGSRDSQVLNLTKEENSFDTDSSSEEVEVEAQEVSVQAEKGITFLSSPEVEDLGVDDTRACTIRFENGQLIKEC